MISVELIPINVRIPEDEVRIVAMQPFIRFQTPISEPFQWSESAVVDQLASINRTLDIAMEKADQKFAKFTIFPEYSIPGILGVRVINERISTKEWPNESIIIAGIHGLSKHEYKELCEELIPSYNQSANPDSIPETSWVNCCVIWVKNLEGIINKWVQLKVRPAWPEMKVSYNDMYCGNILYVFECQYAKTEMLCRFVTLICFDWVASLAGITVYNELFEELAGMRRPELTPLEWVFVIQHNKGPNHPTFLSSTYRFLTDVTHPFVETDKAVVIHSNTAVSINPARNGSGGFSACIFAPNAPLDCTTNRPTVCMQPLSLRASDILERCKDVVFREMGECIHDFTIRVPRFVTPDATDRTIPLPSAFVHAIHEENDDPRLAGGPIPSTVKWLWDTLDTIKVLSDNELVGCILNALAKVNEPDIIKGFRIFENKDAASFVNCATSSFSNGSVTLDESHQLNADLWGKDECGAVEHVLHSVTSLGLAYTIEFESNQQHCLLQNDDGLVQVIAIRGFSHQDCRLHFEKYNPRKGVDPVLVVVRDQANTRPTPEEYSRFNENPGESGIVFLDYQTLIDNCRKAYDIGTLKAQINGILPRNSRII
jgi:hypothetical protein